MLHLQAERRTELLLAAGSAIVMLSFVGCQQKMADQPGYKPLEPCDFFDDGRAARPLVDGTVPRGHLRVDKAYFTGVSGTVPATIGSVGTEPPAPGAPTPSVTVVAGGFDENRTFLREIPIPVNASVLTHGYNRYMIYCAVCHDPLGTGRGKIVERGYTAPPSFHIDRLRESPVGRVFAIVSEGYGSMPSYRAQIPVEDRWAIVAYLRALQLSQHFPTDAMTPAMRAKFAQAADSELSAPVEELLPPTEVRR